MPGTGLGQDDASVVFRTRPGAIPWVVLQVILVVIVIFWPGSVTYWLGRGTGIDPSKINIEIPQPDAPPPLDFGEPPKRP
jgi:hypothetical protein